MGGQQAGADQGEAVLAQAVDAYRDALSSRLIAAYALGSLAHGGFSPLVSDVDLGLILQDPLRMKDRLTIRAVGEDVRAGGPALHQRLSVFWGTPATLQGRARGGRFPPLDRLDLLEHGRLLAGRDRPNCSWRAPSSRSTTWAEPGACLTASWAGFSLARITTTRCARSATRRGWSPKALAG